MLFNGAFGSNVQTKYGWTTTFVLKLTLVM